MESNSNRCIAMADEENVEFLPEHAPLKVPRIDPVPKGVRRPFWSVMIPTFNRPHYLEQALGSILQQDPGPEQMHIEVVDNCTTVSDIELLVRRMGRGRVEYFRQPVNRGHWGNGLTCLRRSRGHWVHILHDDDLVLPGFYANKERLIGLYPDATFLFGTTILVDEALKPFNITTMLGEKEGPLDAFPTIEAIWNHVHTGAAVVPRRIYEELGGYPKGLVYTSDWYTWFGAGNAGRAIFSPVPSALYRLHPTSDSIGNNTRSDIYVKESKAMIDLLCGKLTPQQQAQLPGNRYEWIGKSAAWYAEQLQSYEDPQLGLPHLYLSMKFDGSLRNRYRRSLEIGKRYAMKAARKTPGATVLTNRLNRIGPGNCMSLEPEARAKGLRLVFRSDYTGVVQGDRSVRVATGQPAELAAVIRQFDAYADAVEGFRVGRERIVDYSRPRVHRTRSGESYGFTSLPELESAARAFVASLRLKEGQTVLQLGGDCSITVHQLSRAIGPSGRLVVLEPQVRTIHTLVQDIQRHAMENTKVHRLGLWIESGDLVVSEEDRIRYLPESGDGSNGRVSRIPVIGFEEAERMFSLEQVAAVVVRMDVADFSLFKNAGDFLRRHRPRLAVQAGSARVATLQAILQEQGYAVEARLEDIGEKFVVVARPSVLAAVPQEAAV